jgi:hypothetical protein
MSGHTPGPWVRFMCEGRTAAILPADRPGDVAVFESVGESDARLIAAAPDLLGALHEGRRAIGDHHAPNDCYATGPVTGDAFRDLVECPACAFIAKYDAAIAKALGEQP